jgi:hypothetical protein
MGMRWSLERSGDRNEPRVGRRRTVAALATVAGVGLGGCVSVGVTVSAPAIGDSRVFADLTPTASVAVRRVPVRASLRPAATADLGVRGITVVGAAGAAVWSTGVDPGETTLLLSLPVGQTVELVATDADDRTVEALGVRVGGPTL